MTLGPAERAVLLAFADDEHLMGQRHTEWIGVAPFLEEDLAFSSIAQDELGHAVALYELVGDPVDGGDVDGGDVDVDAFAFGRGRDDWRSCWLVEEPCTDWADALVRHWLYDTAEWSRWEALAGSTDSGIRAVAARALQEERYHRRHADALLDALADDPEATARIGAALDRLLPLAVGMFAAGTEAHGAAPDVVGAPLDDLRTAWCAEVDRRFGPRRWTAVEAPDGHDRTRRGPHFDEMYARMREVFALDPTAHW